MTERGDSKRTVELSLTPFSPSPRDVAARDAAERSETLPRAALERKEIKAAAIVRSDDNVREAVPGSDMALSGAHARPPTRPRSTPRFPPYAVTRPETEELDKPRSATEPVLPA